MEFGLPTENGSEFDYSDCTFCYRPCANPHCHIRYTAASAAWVLIAAMIVFFMKAGFMLIEVSFGRTVEDRRYVVVAKHQDAFASAFGFFLLGFYTISHHTSPQNWRFFGITDPVLWFFKFTFASNAATIIGGCLVTNKYKLRIPAAFVSAFVISGIIHPYVARLIWSGDCSSLSPYRFCSGCDNMETCPKTNRLRDRLYVLDFAGGGAVHLIGGICGLMVCLFAKFQEWWDKKNCCRVQAVHAERTEGVEEEEEIEPEGFWDWMYPVNGGEETVSEAALGVIILWFCWFAFNCGSTESVEESTESIDGNESCPFNQTYPFYGIPSVIAVNMMMAVASGGTIAIIIAVFAQVRGRTKSVNANEIANGVLSSLVAITAGCAFVDYWGACLIGFFAVIFYHLGCFAEYKFGIKDTARVVPVHGVCGLWSVLAAGLFMVGNEARCNLHAAYEGLCYCTLRLPRLDYGEHLLAQLIGALLMITIGGSMSFLMYLILYLIPIKPFIRILEKIPHLLNPGNRHPPLVFRGGWLLTHPDEEFDGMAGVQPVQRTRSRSGSNSAIQRRRPKQPKPARSNQSTRSSNYGTIPLSDERTTSGTQGAQLKGTRHTKL